MALPAWLAGRTGRLPDEGGGAEWGMRIFSEQDGQVISEPAPELSTASSCSHFGQLKMMSISFKLGSTANRAYARRRALTRKSFRKKFLPAGHREELRGVGLVRTAGLEPAHLAALPPQSSVSANSTTCAATSHNEPIPSPGRKIKLDQPTSESSFPAPAHDRLPDRRKNYLELNLRRVHVLAWMVRLFTRSRTGSLQNEISNRIYPALFVIRSQVLEP